MTVKFYCEACEKDQPVIIEEMKADELNLDGRPWGDIVCKECHFVIATVSTDLDKQGQYEFVRVEDETPRPDNDTIYRTLLEC